MQCRQVAGRGPRPLPRGWWSGRRRGLLARDRTAGLPGLFLPSGLSDSSLGENSVSHTVAGPRRSFTGLPGSPPSLITKIWILGSRPGGKVEGAPGPMPLARGRTTTSFRTLDRPTTTLI
jgi:hypothetical protein